MDLHYHPLVKTMTRISFIFVSRFHNSVTDCFSAEISPLVRNIEPFRQLSSSGAIGCGGSRFCQQLRRSILPNQTSAKTWE